MNWISNILDADFIILLAGFVLITLSSNQIAKAFQQARLPLITGLIFTGMIAGPYIIGLIPASGKTSLKFINEIALAYIAFAAGSELYLVELRSKLRTIKISSSIQSIIGLVLGTILIYQCTHLIPFAKELSATGKLVISLLSAVLFIAPSPASVIAVISELRARGPFTKTVLGVTMAKDFLVVVLFAIALSVSKSLLGGKEIQIGDFLFLALELAISFGLSYVVGQLLHGILKWGERKWLKTTLILGLGLGVYIFSNYFRDISMHAFAHEVYLEPLLICLIGSFYVTNYTKYRAEFLKILQDVSHYIYVAFFTLTGASMDIPILVDVWALTLLFFAIRLVTIIIGCSASNLFTKEKLPYYKVGWMPYVAQAGVALGLVTVVADQFPTWGPDFATIGISVIIINQLIGPPLIAKALTYMGENKSRASEPDFDGVKDALIFGHESQSLALALQLQSKNWVVEIATRKSREEVPPAEGVTFHFLEEDGINRSFFDTVNAQKYDAIIGLLSDEENLEICKLVYEEIGTKNMVIRLNDRAAKDQFLAYDVQLVDPSTAIVGLMDHFVRSPQATSLLLGLEEGKDSRDITIRDRDLHGITLRELRLPSDVIILSVIRGGNVIITHGYTRLRVGDVLTCVGSDKSLNELQFKFDS